MANARPRHTAAAAAAPASSLSASPASPPTSASPRSMASLAMPQLLPTSSADKGGPHPHSTRGQTISASTFAGVLLFVVCLVWLAQPRRPAAADGGLLSLRQLSSLAAPGGDPEAEATRGSDSLARAVRLDLGTEKGLDPRQDQRGWMIDPLAVAQQYALQGGTTSCLVTHLGQVLPGKTRGNHRHHLYNETMVLWGAKVRFRNENSEGPKGYGEIILGAGDVAVVACPTMQAHAISNIDQEGNIAYLMACQDGVHDPKDPQTDYNVWPDMLVK